MEADAVRIATSLDNDIVALYGDVGANQQLDDPTSIPHLRWMLTTVIETGSNNTRNHRWIGFVQGVMVTKGVFNLNDERDRVRRHVNE